jgi:hypothetical protein
MRHCRSFIKGYMRHCRSTWRQLWSSRTRPPNFQFKVRSLLRPPTPTHGRPLVRPRSPPRIPGAQQATTIGATFEVRRRRKRSPATNNIKYLTGEPIDRNEGGVTVGVTSRLPQKRPASAQARGPLRQPARAALARPAPPGRAGATTLGARSRASQEAAVHFRSPKIVPTLHFASGRARSSSV